MRFLLYFISMGLLFVGCDDAQTQIKVVDQMQNDLMIEELDQDKRQDQDKSLDQA